MSRSRSIEVRPEDRSQKWRVPLREEEFQAVASQAHPFGEGTLFSPLLFGKFFDPSDAFPLWDLDSEALLSRLRTSGRCAVVWFATDAEYVLKAELPPDLKQSDVEICVENEAVVEISGQWKQQHQHQSASSDGWKSYRWWEFGYVRRIELPEGSNWRKMEANLIDDCHLEIRIPKGNASSSDGNGVVLEKKVDLHPN